MFNWFSHLLFESCLPFKGFLNWWKLKSWGYNVVSVLCPSYCCCPIICDILITRPGQVTSQSWDDGNYENYGKSFGRRRLRPGWPVLSWSRCEEETFLSSTSSSWSWSRKWSYKFKKKNTNLFGFTTKAHQRTTMPRLDFTDTWSSSSVPTQGQGCTGGQSMPLREVCGHLAPAAQRGRRLKWSFIRWLWHATGMTVAKYFLSHVKDIMTVANEYAIPHFNQWSINIAHWLFCHVKSGR